MLSFADMPSSVPYPDAQGDSGDVLLKLVPWTISLLIHVTLVLLALTD